MFNYLKIARMKTYSVIANKLEETIEAVNMKDAMDFFIEENPFCSIEDITEIRLIGDQPPPPII